MDKVRLKNVAFHAYHGCLEEEAEKGRRIEVDVELTGSLRAAGRSDDLSDTCDFQAIYRIVAEAVKAKRYNLLETLGEEICRRLLTAFPGVEVRLVLRKPSPPIEGEIECAEIELVRG